MLINLAAQSSSYLESSSYLDRHILYALRFGSLCLEVLLASGASGTSE